MSENTKPEGADEQEEDFTLDITSEADTAEGATGADSVAAEGNDTLPAAASVDEAPPSPLADEGREVPPHRSGGGYSNRDIPQPQEKLSDFLERRIRAATDSADHAALCELQTAVAEFKLRVKNVAARIPSSGKGGPRHVAHELETMLEYL